VFSLLVQSMLMLYIRYKHHHAEQTDGKVGFVGWCIWQ
jgi:hypothetical protein